MMIPAVALMRRRDVGRLKIAVEDPMFAGAGLDGRGYVSLAEIVEKLNQLERNKREQASPTSPPENFALCLGFRPIIPNKSNHMGNINVERAKENAEAVGVVFTLKKNGVWTARLPD